MEDEELGVSEIARRVGLAKSSTHQLVTTLVGRGMLEQNRETSEYRLGVRLFELGELSLSRIDLRRRSGMLLEALREASGLSTNLAVPSGVDVLFLDRLATLRSLPAYTEFRRRWPLHTTSSGKVMCAFDPLLADKRIAAGLPSCASRTITDETRFRQTLAQIRNQGYAMSHSEAMEGFASIAAPVFDRLGVARSAISVAGAIADVDRNHNEYVRLVRNTTHTLSKAMAQTEWPTRD